MTTKGKVWLGIGGYLVGQAIGAGTINALGEAVAEKFNTKYGEVRDLYYSKKSELTEDKQDYYENRFRQLKSEVENYWETRGKTIFLTVGSARLLVYKKRVKASIESLERIADELRGKVIDAEVID